MNSFLPKGKMISDLSRGTSSLHELKTRRAAAPPSSLQWWGGTRAAHRGKEERRHRGKRIRRKFVSILLFLKKL
jgi:hypothetical protein